MPTPLRHVRCSASAKDVSALSRNAGGSERPAVIPPAPPFVTAATTWCVWPASTPSACSLNAEAVQRPAAQGDGAQRQAGDERRARAEASGDDHSAAAKPGAITREALTEAGPAVLRREGLDALSMRKVAAELGVRAASLYYHVQDKEQLLDLLADGLTWDTRKLTGSGGEKSSASADVCRAIADTYPNIAGLMTMMAGGDTHKLFEFGVERIIDGLRTRLPAEPES